MNCFSCMNRRIKDVKVDIETAGSPRAADSSGHGSQKGGEVSNSGILVNGKLNSPKPGGGARSFTFKELAAATRNFKELNLIGEGGFGCVYKGRLASGDIVAVKQLHPESLQGNQEFIVEVLMLSLLHHPNLVTLTGYCTSGDQRLLVYEYMPMGSLEDHLFNVEPNQQPLSWNTRMKIAAGAARGIEYLHCKANPPVIYRDLKSANILLDKDFNPKLSDFGLAKLGPVGDRTHVSTRVMGTYGYCAPEYAMSGKLTLRSDIYSFGVVLLEIVTGRRANDGTKPRAERNLVSWSRPFLRNQRTFTLIADPLLAERFPKRCLHFVVAIAGMCLNEEQHQRPLIRDIVGALEYLEAQCLLPNGTFEERYVFAGASITPVIPEENPKSLADFLELDSDEDNDETSV